MQQIERYGVIALVFLLVTIVAVSFWGDSKSPGFWSRLTGKSDGKKEQVAVVAGPQTLVADHVTDPNAPLSPAPVSTPLVGAPMTGPAANQPTPTDMPSLGNASTTPPPVAAVQQAPTTALQPTPSILTPVAPQSTTNEYVVQSGDSLAKIASKTLGNANRWKEIQAANGNLDPKSLAPGRKLKIPTGGAVVASTAKVGTSLVDIAKAKTSTIAKPTTAAAKKTDAKSTPKEAAATKVVGTYTVKKGDLIRTIAEAQLGTSDRWKEIIAANPGLDANKLVVGQKLKLPAATKFAEVSKPIVASAEKPRVR